MRNIVVLDAPSNLGLRPPAPGTVPGCYKLAGALRERRIVQRLRALEGGVVVPPRYDRGDRRKGDGVFNAAALGRRRGRLGAGLTVPPGVAQPDWSTYSNTAPSGCIAIRLRPTGVVTGPAMTRAPRAVSTRWASSTSFTAIVAVTLRSTSSSASGPL